MRLQVVTQQQKNGHWECRIVTENPPFMLMAGGETKEQSENNFWKAYEQSKINFPESIPECQFEFISEFEFGQYTKRQKLLERIENKKEQIKNLEKEIESEIFENMLLSDEHQWFTEEEEDITVGKNKRKILVEESIGKKVFQTIPQVKN